MSYSFSTGIAKTADLADAIATARQTYEASIAANDYTLDQASSAQLDKQAAAVAALAADLYGPDAYVLASLVGHVNADNAPGTSASITISTAAEPVAPATDEQKAAAAE